jgi:site-specific recombinase XerC
MLTSKEPIFIIQGAQGGMTTRNYYRAHLRTFGNWLVKNRRLGENPLRHTQGENTRTDRRHDRRELAAEEVCRVLSAARNSSRSFRGLSGPDRFHLYATACGTGFRASALAQPDTGELRFGERITGSHAGGTPRKEPAD